MLSRLILPLTSAWLVLAGAASAWAAVLPPGFSERTIVGGLTRPMDVAWAPDGRMFVIQKDGRLLVVNPASSSAVQVADYSPRVNGQRDRGLLGLAVDASFANNGYLYLLYTFDIDQGDVPESEGEMVSQLLRVRVSPQNTVVGEQVILGTEPPAQNGSDFCPALTNTVDCIPSEGSTHSVGTVRADPDGTLWVGSGDGFSAGSTFPDRVYDEDNMSGKILHIDRDGNGLDGHPFCPDDDDLTHVCTKVHARGFRNPFRFTLRPTGGLVVGDVGWADREEIDLVGAGGGNYGWPCREGSIATPGYLGESVCASATFPKPTTAPVYEYAHAGSNSIVGGPTYTGSAYPAAYRGSVFFGDFTGGFVKRLAPNGSGGLGPQALSFATGWAGVALETAPNGDLVSVDPVDFQQGGRGRVTQIVYRPPPPAVTPTPPAPPPVAVAARDTKGPRLRLLSVQPRRGRLSGTARDKAGVRGVMAALRQKRRRGCAWWIRSRRAMSAGGRSCDRPRWIKAKLRRVKGVTRWTVRLGRRIPRGRYRILVAGADRAGNRARLAPSRATRLRVKR